MDERQTLSQISTGRRLTAPTRYLCAVTDVGKSRNTNEDDYFVSPDGELWIVADGMGGHASGEVASALTIQAIAESMAAARVRNQDEQLLCLHDCLLTAFAAAQRSVCDRSLRDIECRGMGSTVLVGVIEGAILRICHVGNMRAYHLSQSGFRRVTGDHSWVWENLVARGLMQPERVRFHPHRRIITRAIGHKSSKPELTVITLKAGDRVLLCSDGLWEALPNEMIAEIVGSPGSMEDLATILVDAANASGGEDNITAVLYQHTERSKLDGGRAGRIRPALLV